MEKVREILNVCFEIWKMEDRKEILKVCFEIRKN